MAFPDFTPTVPELVRSSAARFGDRTYLVANGERLTYRDVDTRSAALAKGLLAEGIGKGSRVGILMPNSADFVVAALGVARVGAVFVPVNTFSQTRELGWLLRHSDVTHLLAHPTFLNNDYLERLEAALPGLADQRAEQPLFVPDAPFLRAIHVWGPSDRSWSRGDEADIVVAGERAGIDDAFLAQRRGVRGARRPGRDRLQLRQHRRPEGRDPLPGHGGAPLVQRVRGLSDRARRRDVLVHAVRSGSAG